MLYTLLTLVHEHLRLFNKCHIVIVSTTENIQIQKKLYLNLKTNYLIDYSLQNTKYFQI